MDFAAAFKFPFRGPNAWANMGLLAVCFLIPIVGPIVATGFIIVIEKVLIADPLAPAPRFDFSRFSDYLQRGLWPFLIALCLTPVIMLVQIPILLLMVGGMVAFQNQPALYFLLLGLAIVFQLFVTLLLAVALQPVMFKSGLEGSFKAGFDKEFFFTYWRTVGGKAILATLTLFIVSFLLAIPLTCTIVGLYALSGYLLLVQAHFQVQLYAHYLARGGKPLHLAPEPPIPPAPTYAFPPTLKTPPSPPAP
jgi:hypothetical protein